MSGQSEKIVKSEENLKLFRPYEEYVDKLISQALLLGIESRFVFYSEYHYLCLAFSRCVYSVTFFIASKLQLILCDLLSMCFKVNLNGAQRAIMLIIISILSV